MKVAGVHHVAIQVADLERSRAFYVDVLGMLEIKRQPHSIWVQAEASPTLVMLERGDVPAGARPPAEPWTSARQGLHLLALTIAPDARQAWRARLAAAGVAIEKESGFTLYVRDPDGTRVGLSHHPSAAPQSGP